MLILGANGARVPARASLAPGRHPAARWRGIEAAYFGGLTHTQLARRLHVAPGGGALAAA